MTGKDTVYEQALQKLNAYIDAHKMNRSPERETVLKRLCRFQRPVTTAEIVELLAKDHICRATVYNSLRVLTQAEVLYEHYMQGSVRAKEYQLYTAQQEQIQIVCTRCGRKTLVHDTVMAQMVRNRKYNNFNPKHYALYIYGECKSCHRLRKKPQTKPVD